MYKLFAVIYSLFRVLIVFFTTLLVVRFFDEEISAEYLYFLSVTAILPLILTFGFDIYVLKSELNQETTKVIGSYSSFCFLVCSVVSFLGFISYLLAYPVLCKLSIYIVTSFLISALMVFLTVEQKLMRADKKIFYIQFLFPILRLIMLPVVFFLGLFESEISNLLLFFLLPACLALITLLYFNNNSFLCVNFEFKYFSKVLGSSWSYAVMGAVFLAMQNFTMLVAPLFLNSHEMTEFGLALRIGFLSMIPVFSLSAFYNSQLSTYVDSNNPHLVERTLKHSTLLFSSFIVSLILITLLFKEFIILVFDRFGVYLNIELLIISLIAQLFLATFSGMGFLITLRKNIKLEVATFLFSSASSLFFYIIIIRYVENAPKSLMLSYLFMTSIYSCIRAINFAGDKNYILYIKSLLSLMLVTTLTLFFIVF